MNGWTSRMIAEGVRGRVSHRMLAVAVALLGMLAFAGVASAVPAVTSMSPDSGNSGTRVTIVGSGFSTANGGTRIAFAGRSGTGVLCATTTRCQVTVPSGTGAAPVVITVANQTNPPGTIFKYAPVVTKLSPASGTAAGGTVVKVEGAGFLPGFTQIAFGAQPGGNVVCQSSSSCTATSPQAPLFTSVVDVIATAPDPVLLGSTLSSPSTAASRFTYTAAAGQPVLQSISPTSGPSIGGTVITLNGQNFSVTAGQTKVIFGSHVGAPVVNANCSLTTRCTVAAPPGAGTVDLFVRIGTAPASFQSAGGRFTYIAPPTITSVTPGNTPDGSLVKNHPQAGGTLLTVTGIGFVADNSSTSFTFGAVPAVIADCASTTTCTVTTPPSPVFGPVSLVATAGGQSSAAFNFVYDEPVEPVIAVLSPARGLVTGGLDVTVTGARLKLAGGADPVVTFDGVPATVVSCNDTATQAATSCVITTPAHAAGNTNIIFQTAAGVSVVNAATGFGFFNLVNEPPFAGHGITVFPSRDFVSVEGFDNTDAPYTISVIRNGLEISRVDNVTPTFDGTAWLMEVNHPGGECWQGVTPDIDPGTTVRVTGASGISEQTRTADIKVGRTDVTPAAGGLFTIAVHGTAMGLGANRIDIDLLEHRFVVLDPKAKFALSNRRTIRADSVGNDGLLTYDNPGDVTDGRWTARYTVNLADRDLAIDGAESRVMWLGADPLAAVESTIFEKGADVFGGPQAPCAAPWEADTAAPTTPGGFTATQDGPPNLDNVSMTWTESTDNREVTGYRVYRDGNLLKTVSGSALTARDLHVAAGAYLYQVSAVDAAGNESALTAAIPVTTQDGLAPDIEITKSHSGDFKVGDPGEYELRVKNAGTFAADGTITVTDLLPAGVVSTAISSSAGTGTAMTCTSAIQPGGRDLVTCTSADGLATGGSFEKQIDITVSVTAAAAGLVTNVADVAFEPTIGTPDDSVVDNDSASDPTIVDVPDPITVNSPPPAGARGIIAFPGRDFVSGEGYDHNERFTVQVLRKLPGDSTYTLIAQSRGQQPGADDILEINHPGGGCWGGDPLHLVGSPANVFPNRTPNLQPGDKIRFVSAHGWADETTVAGVNIGRPYVAAPGVVRLHGSAQNADGSQMDLGLIEARLIAGAGVGLFENGNGAKRSIIAPGEGTISYDAPGSINFTAEFAGLNQHDQDLALQSEARAMYLGLDALAGNDLTIYERGASPADVEKGPSAPCTSPADTTTPIVGRPDVAIVASHTPATLVVGAPAQQINLNVTNPGTAATSGATTVRDTLPAGITFTGTTSAGWNCGALGPIVTCTFPGSIPASGGAPLALDVAVANAAVPGATNDARVETPGDAESPNNRSTDDITVDLAAAGAPDLSIGVSHDRRFTVGINDNSYLIKVGNGLAGGAAAANATDTITVTDTLPVGMTFNPAGSGGTGWTCGGAATVTCTSEDDLVDGTSLPDLRIFVTVTDAALAGDPVTKSDALNSATVATAGEPADRLSDNTAQDVTIVRAQISPPDTINMIAFPSRDFVSIDGFDMGADLDDPSDGDGLVTVQVWRGGVLVSESAPTAPVDDPETVGADGILEINHVGVNDCWGAAPGPNVTPDIRPGDRIRTVDARGVSYQTTVANARASAAVGLDTDADTVLDTVVVHGIATDASGAPLTAAAFGNLEQRIISGGGLFATGRRALHAPGEGTLTQDGPDTIGWTAVYSGLSAADVATALSGETRILASPDLLAGNDLTIFETGAGTDGGPALAPPCPAIETPDADLGVAITATAGVAGVAQTETVTVTNNGPSAATDVVVTLALPAGATVVAPAGTVLAGAGANQTVSIPALASGNSETISVTFTPAAAGTVVITASTQSASADQHPVADPNAVPGTNSLDIATARIAVT